MQTDDLTLSTTAYHAFLVRQIMRSTTPPNEDPGEARSRLGAIIEMFRAFAPGDAVEAMLATQCVTLHFTWMAAVRAANDTSQDAKTLGRAQAGANAMSRTLQQWIARYHALKHTNEAREKDAARARPVATRRPAARPDAAPEAVAKPPPAPEPEPPAPEPPVEQPVEQPEARDRSARDNSVVRMPEKRPVPTSEQAHSALNGAARHGEAAHRPQGAAPSTT